MVQKNKIDYLIADRPLSVIQVVGAGIGAIGYLLSTLALKYLRLSD